MNFHKKMPATAKIRLVTAASVTGFAGALVLGAPSLAAAAAVGSASVPAPTADAMEPLLESIHVKVQNQSGGEITVVHASASDVAWGPLPPVKGKVIATGGTDEWNSRLLSPGRDPSAHVDYRLPDGSVMVVTAFYGGSGASHATWCRMLDENYKCSVTDAATENSTVTVTPA